LDFGFFNLIEIKIISIIKFNFNFTKSNTSRLNLNKSTKAANKVKPFIKHVGEL